MIIDRHLIRQVAMPCLMVAAVLLIIFVGFSLSRFLNQADAGLLNTAEVARLTLLKVLIALEVLLPIALFFGLMLGLGKLHNDSEIYAMQASGMSETRMIRPVVLMAVLLALCIAVLSVYVRPWAYAVTYEMLSIAEASSDIDRIKAGQFYLSNSSEDGSASNTDAKTGLGQDRAIFIEKIVKDQDLEGIFIRTRKSAELQVISAATGVFTARPQADFHTLELENARLFKQVVDGPDLFASIGHFNLKVKNEQPEPPGYKAKSVESSILRHSVDPGDSAEYQWRVSTPISTLLLALLAIPLSRSKPRHGRYAKLLLALLVYAAYYNLIGINRTWVEQQTTSSIWWTPGLLLLVVVFSYVPWSTVEFALRRPSREQV